METNVNVVNFPGAPPPKTTLGDLAAKFAKIEAQENPDVDVRLADLKAGNEGTIVVPSLGEYSLNNWSRAQIGYSLGLSWDKFFSGASASDCAEDLNRRLGRARGLVRLRTTRAKADDAPGDGTIRAVVSKDFASIKDTMITNLLTDALRTVEPDARIVRSEMTSLSTSFVLKLGEPYRIGGPGNVGEVWGALTVRNSGVGYSKLLVTLSLVRLSCLNGMTAPIGLPSIVRARHRWLDEGQVRESILKGLDGVGERLRRSTKVLADSAHRNVDDVDAEVRRVLQNAKLPLRLARPILTAYGREPHASRFGISQAITLHAQQESPESRPASRDTEGIGAHHAAEGTGRHQEWLDVLRRNGRSTGSTGVLPKLRRGSGEEREEFRHVLPDQPDQPEFLGVGAYGEVNELRVMEVRGM